MNILNSAEHILNEVLTSAFNHTLSSSSPDRFYGFFVYLIITSPV